MVRGQCLERFRSRLGAKTLVDSGDDTTDRRFGVTKLGITDADLVKPVFNIPCIVASKANVRV